MQLLVKTHLAEHVLKLLLKLAGFEFDSRTYPTAIQPQLPFENTNNVHRLNGYLGSWFHHLRSMYGNHDEPIKVSITLN